MTAGQLSTVLARQPSLSLFLSLFILLLLLLARPVGSYNLYGGATADGFALLDSNGLVTPIGARVDTIATTTNVKTIISTSTAFAAMTSGGSVVSWGTSVSISASLTSVGTSIGSNVKAIYSSMDSFVALKSNGDIVQWGATVFSTSGVPISKVYSNAYGAFAGLKSDGTVFSWGTSSVGGTGATFTSPQNFKTIVPNDYGFMGLRSDGSVYYWGNTLGCASQPPSTVTTVKKISPSTNGFAFLKSDGTFTCSVGSATPISSDCSIATGSSFRFYGPAANGGGQLTDTTGVKNIYTAMESFVALFSSGSIATWGTNSGSDLNTAAKYGSGMGYVVGIKSIYASLQCFTALKSNGDIVNWGATSDGLYSTLTKSVKSANYVYSTTTSFAVLQAGVATCWGNIGGSCGTMYGVSTTNANFQSISSNSAGTFIGLRSDGSLAVWGTSAASYVAASSPTFAPLPSPATNNVESIYGHQRYFNSIGNNDCAQPIDELYDWPYVAASTMVCCGTSSRLSANPQPAAEGSTTCVYFPSSQPTNQPSNQPTSQPSRRPSSQPSSQPTTQPTMQPSAQPSSQPSAQPSMQPSSQPSRRPSSQPTMQPSRQPFSAPSSQPTTQPTIQPSMQPSGQPTSQPTMQPSSQPSVQPSLQPTVQPSRQPISAPSAQPSRRPSAQPSSQPSSQPSAQPSMQPSSQPNRRPSSQPTMQPSQQPFSAPSVQPSRRPSAQPSSQPSSQPTTQPTMQPSIQPSRRPSSQPTMQPSLQPLAAPSAQPSRQPSSRPTTQPTSQPSLQPSSRPSRRPSCQPTVQPSLQPISRPSMQPTCQPTPQPSGQPSGQPTYQPSNQPTRQPSSYPSSQPSRRPSMCPSSFPSGQPSRQPTGQPTSQPTCQPVSRPTRLPSAQPSNRPSLAPQIRPSSQPTIQPTFQPSHQPTSVPTVNPTHRQTARPTSQPSNRPTMKPSITPSSQPSRQPSRQPTSTPSHQPNSFPTTQPSRTPSSQPTRQPSSCPTSQPSSQPTSRPSAQPFSRPSRQPTQQPSNKPSHLPSMQPTVSPSKAPSRLPTSLPSSQPSVQPSRQPTGQPSQQPSMQPSGKPSAMPTSQPSQQPTVQPSAQPTRRPSVQPSVQPSGQPTRQPSQQPSAQPSGKPNARPSSQPSQQPTVQPTVRPSTQPSSQPTSQPSRQPSQQPTQQPSSQSSGNPNAFPTAQPSRQPSRQPSAVPSRQPSRSPTRLPSALPSRLPSSQPSAQPVGIPTKVPSCQPSSQPSRQPSTLPSAQPTLQPSVQPSSRPSAQPSTQPSVQPSVQPLGQPTRQPSQQPSSSPSEAPSKSPSSLPTCQPSNQPSMQPSMQPTSQPISLPTAQPTKQPSSCPTMRPSQQPSVHPSSQPSRNPSAQPSVQPTSKPTTVPNNRPTSQPSGLPSMLPSSQPSISPSSIPSCLPTISPSRQPTSQPTLRPSCQPSSMPSMQPSAYPSSQPTKQPSGQPSSQPSKCPSAQPSGQPTAQPSASPSTQPSVIPSSQPSQQPSKLPSGQPSMQPTLQPSSQPSSMPTSQPTTQPSSEPSRQPSNQPTSQPSIHPSSQPSSRPTRQPSSIPSSQPTLQPSSQPTRIPTMQPSCQPSSQPSGAPSKHNYLWDIFVSRNDDYYIPRRGDIYRLDDWCTKDDWRTSRISYNCTFRLAFLYCLYRVPWNSAEDNICRIHLSPSDNVSIPSNFYLEMMYPYKRTNSSVNIVVDLMGSSIIVESQLMYLDFHPIFRPHLRLKFENGNFVGNGFETKLLIFHSKYLLIDSIKMSHIALGIQNVSEVIVENSTFLYTTSNQTAYAASWYFFSFTGIRIWNIETLRMFKCSIALHKAYLFGGALSIRTANDVLVDSTLFMRNTAYNGGAIALSHVRASVFKNCNFVKNFARNAGGILFWFLKQNSVPPQFINISSMNNSAGSYGLSFATNFATFLADRNSSYVTQYDSGQYPLGTIVLWSNDFYGNIIPYNNTVIAKPMNIKGKSSCGVQSAKVFGSYEAVLVNGYASFDKLGVTCMPGGFTTLRFIIYIPNLLIDGNIDYITADSEFFVRFRTCRRGEIFDLKSVLQSSCTVCVDSYSLKDNVDNSVTQCKHCPIRAKKCRSDQIILYAGSWRYSRNTTAIFACQSIYACNGRNLSGDASCRDLHHGPICGICESGSFLNSDKLCEKCQTDYRLITVTAIVSIIVIAILLYIMSTNTVQKLIVDFYSHQSLPTILNIVLTTFQVISLGTATSGRSRQSIPLTIETQDESQNVRRVKHISNSILKGIGIMNFDFMSSFNIECYYRYTHLDKLSIYTSLSGIFIVGCVMYIMYASIRIKNISERRKSLLNVYYYLFCVAFYIVAPLAANIFAYFDCLDFDPFHELLPNQPYRFLSVDLKVDCDSSLYMEYGKYIFVMIAVFPFGIPFAFVSLMSYYSDIVIHKARVELVKSRVAPRFRKSEEDKLLATKNSHIIYILEPYFVNYKPTYWYFDVLDLLQRLALCSILRTMISIDSLRFAFAMMISIFLLYVYQSCSPFTMKSANYVMFISKFMIFYSYFAAFTKEAHAFGPNESLYAALDLTSTFLTIVLVLLSVYLCHRDVIQATPAPTPAPNVYEVDINITNIVLDKIMHFEYVYKNLRRCSLENLWRLQGIVFLELVRRCKNSDTPITQGSISFSNPRPDTKTALYKSSIGRLYLTPKNWDRFMILSHNPAKFSVRNLFNISNETLREKFISKRRLSKPNADLLPVSTPEFRPKILNSSNSYSSPPIPKNLSPDQIQSASVMIDYYRQIEEQKLEAAKVKLRAVRLGLGKYLEANEKLQEAQNKIIIEEPAIESLLKSNEQYETYISKADGSTGFLEHGSELSRTDSSTNSLADSSLSSSQTEENGHSDRSATSVEASSHEDSDSSSSATSDISQEVGVDLSWFGENHSHYDEVERESDFEIEDKPDISVSNQTAHEQDQNDVQSGETNAVLDKYRCENEISSIIQQSTVSLDGSVSDNETETGSSSSSSRDSLFDNNVAHITIVLPKTMQSNDVSRRGKLATRSRFESFDEIESYKGRSRVNTADYSDDGDDVRAMERDSDTESSSEHFSI